MAETGLHAAVRTPLIRLGNVFPQRAVYAKCEFLAPSGSFKAHGIGHLLAHLRRQGSLRPLIVPSMGNTALAAAVGAQMYGFHMVGVVPRTISRDKDEKLQALGAELIKIDGKGSDLLERATEVAEERDGYFVHPHLDPHWTDGYQEIARQILADLPECRSLVFPVGGGGLLMGLTEYLKVHRPELRLYGCEAYNHPTYASFDHPRQPTIADGLVLDVPHAKVQERIAELGIDIALIREEAIRDALRQLYWRQALIVEPSAAVTVAFVRDREHELEPPVALVLTGGNVARGDFDCLIADDDRS